MIIPLPKTEAERDLEIKIVRMIKRRIEHSNMPLQEILNVLERVRHLVTEIKVETGIE